MQKNLKVSIFGKNYVIATDEADDCVQAAALMVDGSMKAKSEKTPLQNEGRLAVVVALELAADLIKNQRATKVLEERIGLLARTLDGVGR